MSAYVCNPEHIGALAAYICFHGIERRPWCDQGDNLAQKAAILAQDLARENIHSVAHIYPNDKDGERPGPCLYDEQVIHASGLYASHFIETDYIANNNLSELQALGLAQSFCYQAYETPDWKTTPEFQQMESLTEFVRAKLGYPTAKHLLRAYYAAEDGSTSWHLPASEHLPSVGKMYDDYEKGLNTLFDEQVTHEAESLARTIIEAAKSPRG